MSFFDFCCLTQKFVIYVTGSDENKELFMEKVFGIHLKDLSFTEYSTNIEGAQVFVQVLKKQDEIQSVHDMHLSMANGVIILSDVDKKLPNTKNALFVYMNGKTRLEDDGNLLVCSVENGNFDDCKRGVQELVKKIKK